MIPCLLLQDRGLYKTVRFSDPTYVGDPINAVRVFNDKEVDELTLLDIAATKQGRIQFDLIEDLAGECFMPLCYGGGIRTLEDAKRLFSLGIEKICLNTAAAEMPSLIAATADLYGSQSVVVSIDVRSGRFRGRSVVVRGGSTRLDGPVVVHAKRAEELGAGEILLSSVDRDGTGAGYDLELLSEVASAVDVPVVANSGAGTLQHLAEAFASGASAVAAGSLFVFQGPHRAVLISYPSQQEQQQAIG